MRSPRAYNINDQLSPSFGVFLHNFKQDAEGILKSQRIQMQEAQIQLQPSEPTIHSSRAANYQQTGMPEIVPSVRDRVRFFESLSDNRHGTNAAHVLQQTPPNTFYHPFQTHTGKHNMISQMPYQGHYHTANQWETTQLGNWNPQNSCHFNPQYYEPNYLHYPSIQTGQNSMHLPQYQPPGSTVGLYSNHPASINYPVHSQQFSGEHPLEFRGVAIPAASNRSQLLLRQTPTDLYPFHYSNLQPSPEQLVTVPDFLAGPVEMQERLISDRPPSQPSIEKETACHKIKKYQRLAKYQLEILERRFQRKPSIIGTEKKELAKQLNVTASYIQSWFRIRRKKNKKNKTQKSQLK